MARPRNTDGLTDRERVFCAAYIKNNFNTVRAYIAAGFSARNAEKVAYKMLKKEPVRKYIEEYIASKWDLSKSEWIKVLRDISNKATKMGDRLRALELIGRSKGFLGSNINIDNRIQNIKYEWKRPKSNENNRNTVLPSRLSTGDPRQPNKV